MLNRTKAINFLLFIIFFALLNITFFYVISNFYFVQRLELTSTFSWSKFIIGCVVTAGIIIAITFIKLNPFVYSFLSITSCIQIFPAIILYQYVHDDWRTVMSPVILFALIVLISKLKLQLNSSRFGERNTYKILIIISLLGLIPFVIVYGPHIQLKNLLLIDIYETRDDVTQSVSNTYTTYTYQWFAKYIIPAIMLFAIAYKNRLVFIGAIISMVFLYLCGANRAVYFGILMVIIFSFGNYLTKAKYFISILITLSVTGLLAFYIFDYNELLRLSIRRLIFIPPILDILYFDFFDDNFLYWSENIMSYWINSPYDQFHSHLIGVEYFRTDRMNANNGIFSDGFLNWGMIGVVINSLIVAIAISFFSQLKVHPKFFGLYFLLLIAIISSSMTTVLITHGMLFLIAFSQLFLKDTEKRLA